MGRQTRQNQRFALSGKRGVSNCISTQGGVFPYASVLRGNRSKQSAGFPHRYHIIKSKFKLYRQWLQNYRYCKNLKQYSPCIYTQKSMTKYSHYIAFKKMNFLITLKTCKLPLLFISLYTSIPPPTASTCIFRNQLVIFLMFPNISDQTLTFLPIKKILIWRDCGQNGKELLFLLCYFLQTCKKSSISARLLLKYFKSRCKRWTNIHILLF